MQPNNQPAKEDLIPQYRNSSDRKETDSMDTDSVDSDTGSVIADTEDDDEKQNDLNYLVNKIHDSFLVKEMWDHDRKAVEQVKNLDT